MYLVKKPKCESDLDNIYLYGLINFGYEDAESYFINLDKAVSSLLNNPYAYQLRENIGYRVRVHRKHKIFYTISDTEIIIVRILHHSQDEKLHLENIDFDDI